MGVATRCVVGGRAAGGGLEGCGGSSRNRGLGTWGSVCDSLLHSTAAERLTTIRIPLKVTASPSAGPLSAPGSLEKCRVYSSRHSARYHCIAKLDSSVFGNQCRKEVVTVEFVTAVDMWNSGLLHSPFYTPQKLAGQAGPRHLCGRIYGVGGRWGTRLMDGPTPRPSKF
jgi:hypothetical protein